MNLYNKILYHSLPHALMVAKLTNQLLKNGLKDDNLKKARSLVLAGLLHDAGHNSLTNANCASETGDNKICQIKYTKVISTYEIEFADKSYFEKIFDQATLDDDLQNFKTKLEGALSKIFCETNNIECKTH